MAYVDLNLIRAKMAKTPETSDHTSIQQRINTAKYTQQPNNLIPFVGSPRQDMPKDYCELVDTTGKKIKRLRKVLAQILKI
jgi:hypothetical protein|tara:strand:- start:164 stop:406 length:243 start_codon:yes stop_codon:yes gene_type:complete